MKNCEDAPSEFSFAFNQESREIYLTGMICPEMYQSFISAFRELDRGKGPILLVLNTVGGQFMSTMGIYEAIKLSHNRVICHCYGVCMSGGMVVLAACDERYSTQSCRFMTHSVQAGLSQMNQKSLKNELKEIDESQDKMVEVLSRESDLTIAEARALCGENNYMSADQIMGLGFLEGILVANKKNKSKRRK
jgi:ATP-dependent protease ClpP protease subunit